MATQNQDRLRTHFASLDSSPTSQGSGWDTLWETSTFLPWDRGLPNPALIDLLASPAAPPVSTTPNPTPGAPAVDAPPPVVELPKPVQGGKRGKVLVPGCGKGYDVKLFAAYGWDAVGLEVSPHAAKAAEGFLGSAAEDEVYKVRDGGEGAGSAVCVVGDFFADGWLADAGVELQGGFDVIYDNTVCSFFSSLANAGPSIVQYIADSVLGSSFAPCPLRSAPNGLPASRPSSPRTASSSALNSLLTSPLPRAGRRGRCRPPFMRSC